MKTFHEFSAKTIDGNAKNLADYKGKVLLVVNVASNCGYTKQYAGLEALHKELAARGFAVLGFPCNQFGAQEPGTETVIQDFCEKNYGVTFPLFSKIDVNGPTAAPVYSFLTSTELPPGGKGDIPWNFGKFVIGKDGKPVARFSHKVKPEDAELRKAIESALT